VFKFFFPKGGWFFYYREVVVVVVVFKNNFSSVFFRNAENPQEITKNGSKCIKNWLI